MLGRDRNIYCAPLHLPFLSSFLSFERYKIMKEKKRNSLDRKEEEERDKRFYTEISLRVADSYWAVHNFHTNFSLLRTADQLRYKKSRKKHQVGQRLFLRDFGDRPVASSAHPPIIAGLLIGRVIEITEKERNIPAQ